MPQPASRVTSLKYVGALAFLFTTGAVGLLWRGALTATTFIAPVTETERATGLRFISVSLLLGAIAAVIALVKRCYVHAGAIVVPIAFCAGLVFEHTHPFIVFGLYLGGLTVPVAAGYSLALVRAQPDTSVDRRPALALAVVGAALLYVSGAPPYFIAIAVAVGAVLVPYFVRRT